MALPPNSLPRHLHRWWHRLPVLERLFLFFTGFIAAVAIPLSVHSLNLTSSLSSRAYSHSPRLNRPPQLTAQSLNCRLNLPCSARFYATDPDLVDQISLNLDFLPVGLQLSSCTHDLSFNYHLRLLCAVEGTPKQAGRFLLRASVSDLEAATADQTIKLDIR